MNVFCRAEGTLWCRSTRPDQRFSIKPVQSQVPQNSAALRKCNFGKNPKYTLSRCCIRNVLQWFREWYVQASSNRAEDRGTKRGHCSSTALIESSYCSTANLASFSEANAQNSRRSGRCKRSPRANARQTAPPLALRDARWSKIHQLAIRGRVEPEISLNRWRLSPRLNYTPRRRPSYWNVSGVLLIC